LLLEQSGQGADALAQYELALTKTPDDPDVLLRVGCARVVKGDGKGAEEALRSLLKTAPRSAEVNYCAGRALFLQGKHLEALKRLQHAIDLDSNRAEYHLYVGWAASEAGQLSLAQEQLDKALELDQGLADAYWQRGALSAKEGASADAVTDLKRALKLRPERFEAHADLAQAYTQLGREHDAMAEWQLATAGDETNPTWQFRYGKLLSAQHKNEEAARRLTAAVKLSEKETQPPNWISQAHFLLAISLGGGTAALPHYRRFLETGPLDSPYRAEAKRVLQRAGQPWEGK
jgi:tetratricopeptide (TPR) repeat protein